MHHYCTYFDSNYLVKGLALYRSLERHDSRFTLWVLALDDRAFETLRVLNLDHVRVISLGDFEDGDTALADAKKNRSRIEYIFTCTPSLPLYILDRNPDLDSITYLDSDLYCFSNPQPVFDAFDRYSILITPHRFPPALRERERYGIYNVGVVGFRNDDTGRECLNWWRRQCLEWCYDRLDGERFGDQGYLNHWPEQFSKVLAIDHAGVNAAPWNWMSYRIHQSGAIVHLDDDPLIFFHFHQLRQLNGWLCDPGLSSYGGASSELRRRVYAPYLRELKDTWTWVHSHSPNASPGYKRLGTSRESARQLIKDLLRATVRGQLILTPGNRVI